MRHRKHRDFWKKFSMITLASLLLVTAIPFNATFATPKKSALDLFTDVPLEHPFFAEITALAQEGIIQGYADSTFRPDETLQPEHAAVLLERVLADQDYAELLKFLSLDSASESSSRTTDSISLLLETFQLEEWDSALSSREELTRGQYVSMLYHLTHQHQEQIALEDFFRKPTKASFEPSPNGEHLAFLQPWENRMNIFVQLKGEADAVQITHETEQDIRSFGWLTDSRLLYMLDTGGDENYRLYAVDLDGTNTIELTPYENTVSIPLDLLKNNEQEILIQMNKRDPRIFDVYRLNVHTAELTLVAENPGNITGWLTDHQGAVRLATATEGDKSLLLYRETENDEFRIVQTTNYNERFQPLLFAYNDSAHIYALSNVGRDKTALVEFDLDTGHVLDTLFEHEEVDVSGVLSSDKQQKLLGTVYVTDKTQYHFFDQSRAQLQQNLEKKLPNYEIDVLSISPDETTVILLASNDKSRGTYYSYSVQTDELTVLAELNPWLKEEQLADMKPIQYTARDGLTIHGYLTLPKGIEAKQLPVVINPHGGPWARDRWGYNPEVQFLASRGYAVLQMNFRGSTGYGREFLDAGNKQWGQAMQDDITDGVQWLIDQGIADPERVAIYGASYGGYAALAGVTFTPDLYAAGVSYVGPSNLFTLLDSLPPYWEPERRTFHERMGHPVEDKDLLQEVSPLFHVDQITAPLFIAQGANDPRVKQAESDQIVAALQERGVQVPYMLKANEGHGFRNQENVFDFYRALENFLGLYLSK